MAALQQVSTQYHRTLPSPLGWAEQCLAVAVRALSACSRHPAARAKMLDGDWTTQHLPLLPNPEVGWMHEANRLVWCRVSGAARTSPKKEKANELVPGSVLFFFRRGVFLSISSIPTLIFLCVCIVHWPGCRRMGSGDSAATAAQRPGGAHTAARSPRVCRPHPHRACRPRYHGSRAHGLHAESAKVGAKWNSVR